MHYFFTYTFDWPPRKPVAGTHTCIQGCQCVRIYRATVSAHPGGNWGEMGRGIETCRGGFNLIWVCFGEGNCGFGIHNF